MIATGSPGFLRDAAAAFFSSFTGAINAQHFGHLFRKLGIALFQVVAHLVRLGHRTGYECGEHARSDPRACTTRYDQGPGTVPRRFSFRLRAISIGSVHRPPTERNAAT